MKLDLLKELLKNKEKELLTIRETIRKSFDDITSDENLPLFYRWCFFMTHSEDVLDLDNDVFCYDKKYLPNFEVVFCGEEYIFKDNLSDFYVDLNNFKNNKDKSKIFNNFKVLPDKFVNDIINSGYCGCKIDYDV
ncbi:hypothetical protein [Proteus phage 3H10_20]|uniref:Uncharacterized protein n=1 Tax=Proteus phage 3H10_20 TaxID=2772448 RepID=A0A7L7SNH5_9CAUD|nr:hypothetical protein PQC37_gp061 [Proteus phage 3H10_20]QOC54847.1 hypothetical protein [Proteus phage 3H10_20]